MARELTRRRALRLGAATAGLGATAGLAGCSAVPFVGGGGYAAWLPAPGAISERADAYRFEWQNATQIRNNERSFDAHAYERFGNRYEAPLDLVGLDFDDLNAVLHYQRVIVVRASLDRDEVADELADEDFAEALDHGDYTIYETTDGGQAIGVSGNTAIFGSGAVDTGAAEVVETAIETKAGDEDRYRAENDDFDTLVGNLPTGTFTNGQARAAGDERVGFGVSLSVNGPVSTVTSVRVHESADAIEQAQVDALRTEIRDAENVEDPTVTRGGRVLTVTYDVDTGLVGTDEFPGYGF